jgi:CDP-diacylglycerol--glycerol-3-phosphate 3-phosphatidyltransferase
VASIYNLKSRFQKVQRPVMEGLHRLGVSPNHLTAAGVVLSGGLGAAIAFSPLEPRLLLVVPAGLLVRMALNAMDGLMAREKALATTAGQIFNELADVASDLLIYAALFVVVPAPAVVALFILTAILGEFVGVLGAAAVGDRRYDGPMGKSDRAFWVGAYCLAAAFWPAQLSAVSPLYFSALTLLSGVTVGNRTAAAFQRAAVGGEAQ